MNSYHIPSIQTIHYRQQPSSSSSIPYRFRFLQSYSAATNPANTIPIPTPFTLASLVACAAALDAALAAELATDEMPACAEDVAAEFTLLAVPLTAETPLLLLIDPVLAAAEADARAEEREAGVVVMLPVADEEDAPLAVEEAVAAHVAAVGRLDTPWPWQRASANLIVAIHPLPSAQLTSPSPISHNARVMTYFPDPQHYTPCSHNRPGSGSSSCRYIYI